MINGEFQLPGDHPIAARQWIEAAGLPDRNPESKARPTAGFSLSGLVGTATQRVITHRGMTFLFWESPLTSPGFDRSLQGTHKMINGIYTLLNTGAEGPVMAWRPNPVQGPALITALFT